MTKVTKDVVKVTVKSNVANFSVCQYLVYVRYISFFVYMLQLCRSSPKGYVTSASDTIVLFPSTVR